MFADRHDDVGYEAARGDLSGQFPPAERNDSQLSISRVCHAGLPMAARPVAGMLQAFVG